MPAANPALAAGPLANQPPVQQGPVAPGAHAPSEQSFANAMRGQMQQTQRPDDAQAGSTEVAAPVLQRGIFAARASPDIPTLGATNIAPEVRGLISAVDTDAGNILPVGNVLPNPEIQATADESLIPATVTNDSLHAGIIVPSAPPDAALTAAVAGSRGDLFTPDARPAIMIGNTATGAASHGISAPAAQPDQITLTSNSTGGQSANADSGSQNQAYRAMESMLMNNLTRDDTTIATSPKFVIPSDSAVTPAIHAIGSAPGPGALTELIELPQMQSMRPLQPAADPQLFSSGLGNRLMLMSRDGVQSARLKLHPENLGPLDVRIQVEDDGARVWFGAQHGQTREALEAAIPRLRELFADQGLQLVRADVTSGQERQQTADGSVNRADPDSAVPTDAPTDRVDSFIPSLGQLSDRLLDVYV